MSEMMGKIENKVVEDVALNMEVISMRLKTTKEERKHYEEVSIPKTKTTNGLTCKWNQLEVIFPIDKIETIDRSLYCPCKIVQL